MIKIIKDRYSTFILHGLLWSLVLFLPYLVSDVDNQYKIGPLPGLYFTISGLIHMVIFYSNTLYLYPKFVNRVYWWVYLISVILLLILSVRVKLYVLALWFPSDLQQARSHVLFPSMVTFIVSVFYSIAYDKIRAEKLQKENEALQLGMELKLLRSQISPHFLFNILTNLVSLARKKSDHLENSLLMLSGLMRYILYDAGKKISLQQEVEYLESYIALQQLRYGQDVKIACTIDLSQEEKSHHIEPMLLIPFIENAFKHGTGYVDGSFIDIILHFKQGVLVLQVRNKFDLEKDPNQDESSGIGLNNVRSRITLLYPGRHELLINSDHNLFCVHLTLKL